MMRRKGKHAKEEAGVLAKIAAAFVAALIIIQALMLNDRVRNHLSVVDFFEGQSVGQETKQMKK